MENLWCFLHITTKAKHYKDGVSQQATKVWARVKYREKQGVQSENNKR